MALQFPVEGRYNGTSDSHGLFFTSGVVISAATDAAMNISPAQFLHTDLFSGSGLKTKNSRQDVNWRTRRRGKKKKYQLRGRVVLRYCIHCTTSKRTDVQMLPECSHHRTSNQNRFSLQRNGGWWFCPAWLNVLHPLQSIQSWKFFCECGLSWKHVPYIESTSLLSSKEHPGSRKSTL